MKKTKIRKFKVRNILTTLVETEWEVEAENEEEAKLRFLTELKKDPKNLPFKDIGGWEDGDSIIEVEEL